MANYTSNLNLKKPEPTDNYNVSDQNGNMDILDTAVTSKETPAGAQAKADAAAAAGVAAASVVQGNLAAHLTDTTQYSTYKLNQDSNGIYTEVQYKRVNGSLIMKSILSGGTSPLYTTRTVTNYAQNGTTITSTKVYTITYTNGEVTSEVLA